MAMTEDVARLVIETLGTEQLDALKAKLATLPAQMGELNAAFGRGAMSVEEYNAEAKRLQATHTGLSASLGDLEKAAGKSTNKMAGLGQAGLQSGRVIQDFAQGGVGGILNNIEGLSMALGGGPGLAGILTGLGVGFFLLKEPIKAFMESLGVGAVKQFVDQTERLKDELKELNDKPVKLAIDYRAIEETERKIKELQKAKAALEKFTNLRGHYEKESGASIEGMFAEEEGGSEALVNRMKAKAAAAAELNDPKLQEAKAEVDKAKAALARARDTPGLFGDDAASQASAVKLAQSDVEAAEKAAGVERKAAYGRAGDSVGTTLETATHGGGAAQLQAQQQLARMLRGAGNEGLARGVEAASPQQQERNDLADEAQERSIEDMKERRKRREAGEKAGEKAGKLDLKDEKLTDRLNEQGAENERVMRKRNEEEAAKDVREAQQQANHRAAETDRKLAGRQKTLEGTSIDEQAAVASMRMRAAGMGEAARRQELMRGFSGNIRQSMPDLGMLERTQLAQRMTSQAEGQSGQHLEQARTNLAQQGLKGQQLTNQAMRQALQTTTTMAQQHATLTGEVHQLEQGFRQVERLLKQHAPARGAHKRGGG